MMPQCYVLLAGSYNFHLMPSTRLPPLIGTSTEIVAPICGMGAVASRDVANQNQMNCIFADALNALGQMSDKTDGTTLTLEQFLAADPLEKENSNNNANTNDPEILQFLPQHSVLVHQEKFNCLNLPTLNNCEYSSVLYSPSEVYNILKNMQTKQERTQIMKYMMDNKLIPCKKSCLYDLVKTNPMQLKDEWNCPGWNSIVSESALATKIVSIKNLGQEVDDWESVHNLLIDVGLYQLV